MREAAQLHAAAEAAVDDQYVYLLAHHVLPVTFVLHAGYRFGWDAKDGGFYAGDGRCASIIVQGGLVGKVVKAIGERKALLAGLASGLLH